MVSRPPALFVFLLVICIYEQWRFAEDAGPETTQIIASYRVYSAGSHFGRCSSDDGPEGLRVSNQR